jgi:hypothetical protein
VALAALGSIPFEPRSAAMTAQVNMAAAIPSVPGAFPIAAKAISLRRCVISLEISFPINFALKFCGIGDAESHNVTV